MGKGMLFTLLMTGSFAVGAQQHVAIQFVKNDLAAALLQAGQKDKIIFVDAYATWCGPCKMMDQNVFSDSLVGAFFNQNFINLKLDMEKGDGPHLAEKYAVRAYPTFLFLSATGDLLHQGLGYHPVQKIITLGQDALNPKKQITTLKREYKNGNRDSDFLIEFAMALFECNDSMARDIGQVYLATQSNWASPVNIPVIARMVQSYGDPYYDFMVHRRYLFVKQFGEGE